MRDFRRTSGNAWPPIRISADSGRGCSWDRPVIGTVWQATSSSNVKPVSEASRGQRDMEDPSPRTISPPASRCEREKEWAKLLGLARLGGPGGRPAQGHGGGAGSPPGAPHA